MKSPLTDKAILKRYGALFEEAFAAFHDDPTYVVDIVEAAALARKRKAARLRARKPVVKRPAPTRKPRAASEKRRAYQREYRLAHPESPEDREKRRDYERAYYLKRKAAKQDLVRSK